VCWAGAISELLCAHERVKQSKVATCPYLIIVIIRQCFNA
jgi:hypothetical protein